MCKLNNSCSIIKYKNIINKIKNNNMKFMIMQKTNIITFILSIKYVGLLKLNFLIHSIYKYLYYLKSLMIYWNWWLINDLQNILLWIR